MMRNTSIDLATAVRRFLQCAYAKSGSRKPTVDDLLAECFMLQDEPPSASWVAPFASMTAVCCEKQEGWGSITYLLFEFAEQIAGFLITAKCDNECLDVYEQLVATVFKEDVVSPPVGVSILAPAILESVSNRDDLIASALCLEEGVGHVKRCDQRIKDKYLQWLSGNCDQVSSANYILSITNSSRLRVSLSYLYKREDFRASVVNDVYRRKHIQNGWPILEPRLTAEDKEYVYSMLNVA